MVPLFLAAMAQLALFTFAFVGILLSVYEY